MSRKIIGVTVGTSMRPQSVIEKTEQAEQIVKNTRDINQLSKQIDEKQPKGNYLTEHQDLSGYATTEQLNRLSGEIKNLNWNDLKGRPFYDEKVVLYENPEFYIDDMRVGYAEVGSNFLVDGDVYEVEVDGRGCVGVCVAGEESGRFWLDVWTEDFVVRQYADSTEIEVGTLSLPEGQYPLKISHVVVTKQLAGKYVNLYGYAKEKWVKAWVDENYQPKGSYPTEVPEDYTLPIGGENLGGVKNGGNVVINPDGTMTAPEAGVSSWDDLVDRPFYDETAVLYENPEIFLDMGEADIPIESNFVVVGETYDVEINGEVYSCVCAEPEAEEDYGLLRTENLSIAPYKNDDEDRLYIYCNNTKLADKDISLKISGTNTKTLDTKYLPEQLQFGNEETIVLYENKAMLLESDFGDGEPPGCYYEGRGSTFLVVGKTYDVEVNGVHYSAACYDISEDEDGTYPVLDVGDIAFESYQRDDGSWKLEVYSDEFVDTTISVKISQTNIKKLDSKYLPDSLMERIAQLDGESANLTEMLETVGVKIPSINLNDGVYTYGRFATYGTEYDGDSPISKSFRNANYLRVTGGRTIALYYAKSEWNDNNAELSLQIVQYDYTKKVIGERTDVRPYAANQTTFTLNENTAYIRFCLPMRDAAITTPLSDIQIAIYYIEDYVNTWISPEPTVLGDKQVLNLQNAVLPSSTAGSTKKFMLTVNDAGVISAIEMT